MSPSASIDYRSALQVAPERIARLKDAELGKLMGQLLRAQSHRCGAPVSELLTNTEEKAADDGADAWSGKPETPDEWLGDAETCWQLKAGDAGEPAKVKKEIGKRLPKVTLTKGGRFVLVASGSTSGKKGETDRLETLTTEAEAAGLPTDRIVVIGSERLAEWVNQHPAIAARWANRPEGLWTLQDWPAQEHQAPWQASDPLASAIATYRQALDPTIVRPDEPCLHLHLHCPPGAGKTRLALELCKQAPWADFVVYVQQARESNVLSLLAQAASEEGVRFVVVADDTPAELLKPLRDALEPSEGRIRLITLGTSHSPDPRRICELAVDPLSTDSLSELLGCWYPAMAAELVSTVVNLAAGNPRLARLAADALNQNPALTTATLTEQPAIRELRTAIASHQKPKGRSDWTWPQPWDFTTYRSDKRQGFVGREWLFEEVRAWATNPDSKQALLIGADYGVGKSAFLAELLDTGAAGLPVVAHHFCRADISDTLEAGRFVRSLASQLAEALPAYRALLEADDAKELRETLDQANQKPLPAFDQAVLAPLRRIEAPATQLLLVIDALDEALDYRPEAGGNSRYTIVDLLAKEAPNLPPWLRVLATSRRRDEVLKPLREGFFSIEEINAEEAENLVDIHAYVQARCEQEPMAPILSRACLSAIETADVLQTRSGGKFLYAVRVLNDLASGALTLENRQSLDALPPGMDGFYEAAFERRFPEEASYLAVQPILALLCEQREPLGFQTLAAMLGLSVRNVSASLQPLNDLLRLMPVPAAEGPGRPDVLCSFDHLSLEQWLSEENEYFQLRAGRFGVDREVAAEQLHTWALAEVAANRAHTSPYLVRHLASHLRDDERAEVIGGQLLQFPWLQARLKLAGLTALLGDFNPTKYEPNTLPPEVTPLERALRQAAHVLSHDDGWNGQDQLASQLLARLPNTDALLNLLVGAEAAAKSHSVAQPRHSSLLGQEMLNGTLVLGGYISAVATLSDGRVAAGSGDSTISLWDPRSCTCTKILRGHNGAVHSLVALGYGLLASGSEDTTIRIWDMESYECIRVLHGHSAPVLALAVLNDGRLASGSNDSTVRIWDIFTRSCTRVLEGFSGLHGNSLAATDDGNLAFISEINSVALWDSLTDATSFVLSAILDYSSLVWSLTSVGYGRLAAGLENGYTYIIDTNTGTFCHVLTGHASMIWSIGCMRDGRLVCAAEDGTIRIWDLSSGIHSKTLEGFGSTVLCLAEYDSSYLILGLADSSIRFLDLSRNSCLTSNKRHQDSITALLLVGGDTIASGSADATVRLWNATSGECQAILKGHEGPVTSLALLSDAQIASGSEDSTLRMWDLASGVNGLASTIMWFNESERISALGVLSDGSVAVGTDFGDIHILRENSKDPSALIEVGYDNSVRTIVPLMSGSFIAGLESGKVCLCSAIHEDCVELDEVYGLAFALLGGQLIASGNRRGEIRLSRLNVHGVIAIYHDHNDAITSLAMVGDGLLASGSKDRTIRLWDPTRPDGAPRVLFVADAGITALAWIPTHQLLVAGDASGRLHWLVIGPLKR